MEELHALIGEMRKFLYPYDGNPLEPAFINRIDRYPRATFIAAVFRINQSSVAQDILVNLPTVMRSINYQDLVLALAEINGDELALNHYSDFVTKLFGVDFHKMGNAGSAEECPFAPSDWSAEYLGDRNIPQQELLGRMRSHGAPMIPIKPKTTGMDKEQALKIALLYQRKHHYTTKISAHTTAIWYEAFESVDGPAWIIEASLPRSTFEGSDTLTYVVSVKERCAKYIINASGFPKFPDDPQYSFTDKELDELKEMGFDILE